MEGKMTTITNILEDKSSRNFSFDFSYWSHDSFTEDDTGYLNADAGSNYARKENKNSFFFIFTIEYIRLFKMLFLTTLGYFWQMLDTF